MIYFADTLPDPNNFASIGWLCVITVSIITGARQVMKFVRDLKDKPSPGEVLERAREEFQPKGDYATAENLAEIKREMTSALEKISEENQDIMKNGDDREARLQTQLRALSQEIAAQPSKIIADLVNAKNFFASKTPP